MSDRINCRCFSIQLLRKGSGGWFWYRDSQAGFKINVDMLEPDVPHAWTGKRWEAMDQDAAEGRVLLALVLCS